jgi:anti-sigma regulatory factor (Ser/Thr protein kinase)
VTAVRRELASWLDDHGIDDERAHPVLLVASELTTNAVIAARKLVHLAVELGGTAILVEVRDDGPGFPPAPPPHVTSADPSPAHDLPPGAPAEFGVDERGRGLVIVDRLSREVTVRSDAAGTLVRATITLDDAR